MVRVRLAALVGMLGALLALSPTAAAAQAQAANGNIEGIVRDTTGARAAGRLA